MRLLFYLNFTFQPFNFRVKQMIYSVSGKIVKKTPEFVVVEAGGVGYKINMSGSKANGLAEGKSAKIFCSFRMGRDSMDLFGFASEKELEFFDILTAINGIGAKAAIKIIGESDEKKLFSAAEKGDVSYFEELPGVGRKKAMKITFELQEKMGKRSALIRRGRTDENAEVYKALKNLGYLKAEIGEAIESLPEGKNDFEKKLKSCLKYLAKKQ